MISFNLKHFNMERIRAASGLRSEVTQNYFRIFGLKKTKYDVVVIYPEERDCETYINKISDIFGLYGISASFEERYSTRKVQICLSKKLRKDIPKCVAVLKTIIMGMEGRIRLS